MIEVKRNEDKKEYLFIFKDCKEETLLRINCYIVNDGNPTDWIGDVILFKEDNIIRKYYYDKMMSSMDPDELDNFHSQFTEFINFNNLLLTGTDAFDKIKEILSKKIIADESRLSNEKDKIYTEPIMSINKHNYKFDISDSLDLDEIKSNCYNINDEYMGKITALRMKDLNRINLYIYPEDNTNEEYNGLYNEYYNNAEFVNLKRNYLSLLN